MAATNYQPPTSQLAAQIDAKSDPISSIRINQHAEVPTFPSSGVYTLVRVLYTSIDPIDYKFLTLPWPVPRLALGSSTIIPGTAFVGQVWKTTHPDLTTGDVVWGKHEAPSKFGTCAPFTLVSGVQGIGKIPNGWTQNHGIDELAAAALVARTALQTLQAGDLPYNTSGGQARGGTVFINGGSGGVGTFTVQMAKAVYGCDKVVVSCSSANVDLVRSLGADEVVDYRKLDKRGLSGWLKDWSVRNGQLDVIIDNVGSDPNLYWQCHHYLKADRGQYVQIGGGLDFTSVTLLMRKMLWPGALGGGKRPFQFLNTATKKEDLELIGQWMVEGKIKAVIEDSNRFDLTDVGKAYQKLNTGRTRGKIVIKVDADDEQ